MHYLMILSQSCFQYCTFFIVQELFESRGGRPGLSVLTSLLDFRYIEPCFGIGLSLSLICQLTSEDIKLHFIIINCTFLIKIIKRAHAKKAIIIFFIYFFIFIFLSLALLLVVFLVTARRAWQ